MAIGGPEQVSYLQGVFEMFRFLVMDSLLETF